MRTYRKYYFSLCIVIIGVLAATAFFNMAIDPYGIWGAPVVRKINLSKPELFYHVRLFKASEVVRKRPDVLLLGNSTTMFGLDPGFLSRTDQRKAYNLGIPGANLYEQKRYFQHALQNNPDLKKVFIPISYMLFINSNKEAKPDFTETRLGIRSLDPADVLETTLSVDSLKASVRTLKSNRANPDYRVFYDNGRATEMALQHELGNPDLTEYIPKAINEFTSKSKQIDYSISDSFLNDFLWIIKTCRQNNIAVVVFIPPSPAISSEVIFNLGLELKMDDWKREMVKYTPVWDFSGYNSVTTEPIKRKMEYFYDHSHYSKKTGDLMLSGMLQTDRYSTPKDFGYLLTTKNIEVNLAKMRAERQRWIRNNPDALKLLKGIKQGTY